MHGSSKLALKKEVHKASPKGVVVLPCLYRRTSSIGRTLWFLLGGLTPPPRWILVLNFVVLCFFLSPNVSYFFFRFCCCAGLRTEKSFKQKYVIVLLVPCISLSGPDLLDFSLQRRGFRSRKYATCECSCIIGLAGGRRNGIRDSVVGVDQGS